MIRLVSAHGSRCSLLWVLRMVSAHGSRCFLFLAVLSVCALHLGGSVPVTSASHRTEVQMWTPAYDNRCQSNASCSYGMCHGVLEWCPPFDAVGRCSWVKVCSLHGSAVWVGRCIWGDRYPSPVLQMVLLSADFAKQFSNRGCLLDLASECVFLPVREV